METLLLAKFFGLYFLAIGLVFLINPKRIYSVYDRMIDNDGLLYVGGVIALLLGAFVISIHNIWIMGWPLIITIIGWLSLAKGFGLMVYPGFARYFSPLFRQSSHLFRALGFLLALLGLFLTYQGWM